MPWTITRTDATIRLDVMDNLDDEGRPGSHRVFEYSLDDDAFRDSNGELAADDALAKEVRRRARAQLADETAAANPTPVDAGPDVEIVASGDRL